MNKPNFYPKGKTDIMALYVVKNMKDDEVYGPETFKLCSEEARRLIMISGHMYKVVRT